MLSTLCLLVALANPAAGWAEPLVPPALASFAEDEELQARIREFKRQALDGVHDVRAEALEALLATGADEAYAVLADALGALGAKLHEQRARVERQRLEVGQLRRLIADLGRRVERDQGLREPIKEQQRELEELEQKISRRKAALRSDQGWYDLLGLRSLPFAARVSASARKKVEKALWKVVEGDGAFDKRFGAIDALGSLAGPGTASGMQENMAGLVKTRTGLQHKLPKQMGEVRELEARMQEEAERTGGRSSYGEQYERLIREAKETQQQIGSLGHLCEVMVNAGGRALAREEGKHLERSMQGLMRAQKKGKDGVRRYTLRMLGACGLPEVRTALLAMMLDQEDPMVRVTLIDALALGASAESAPELEAALMDKGLDDETWLVKGRAARALASMRSGKAVPALIGRLPTEEGRSREEFQGSLRSLTGLDYHGNAALWARWWEDNGDDFVVPSVEKVAEIEAARDKERREGTGFFGIRSSSKHVLFVVDLSGSMVFSMIPRNNPDDDTSNGRRPDMPLKGERSRLAEAKLALITAIGGMGKDGNFNLVFYASNVWSWKSALQPLTDDNVAEAFATVSELDAVGGTNIYGALRLALDMAGAQTSDRWAEPLVDTIYFLSDGRPSVGITTDPDEILQFVRERNASAGIAIHTVGLSGAQDAYLLGRLAEENGGSYVAR
ncbi:MAG: hypothetical protein ACI9F9_002880 [Candidatus Paceibacteria bacterium]|jgi:hypothetical protein